MIRTINSIEVSSVCDNQCPYCPAPLQHQHRPIGLMTMATFETAIGWVHHFARQGTQKELNLFGVGEPTLNPHLVEMVRLARERMPLGQRLHLNTNGNRMTLKLARELRDAGIDSVDITGHNPRAAANTIRILQTAGICGQLSVDFMTQPNNWAGQVDWFEPLYRYPCQWLRDGQVMIMSDGRVTTCCLDAFAGGVFATVDDDLAAAAPRAHALCRNCHHDAPAAMLAAIDKGA